MGFTLNQHEQEKQIKKLQKKKDQDTTNYNDLDNLPQINSVELKGDKSLSDLGIQEELTFDDTPTDGSNNPVKSGGIYDSEKDIYAVMGQMGAKNLVPFPYDNASKTLNGVTFTINNDGTVSVQTVSGGATAQTTFSIQTRASGKIALKAGSYKLTGCPIGGGTAKWVLAGGNTNISPNVLFTDSGNGTQFSINNNDIPVGMWITVAKDCVIETPIIFKPLLIVASDTDPTYQPYAKTNKQLTDDITGIIPHILPDAPTTDGSYNLKVTVTSGEAAYSWGAVTP